MVARVQHFPAQAVNRFIASSYAEYATYSGALTGTVSNDDNPMANTDGDEILTVAHQPEDTTHRLRITAAIPLIVVDAVTLWGMGIFQDSTADALAGLFNHLSVTNHFESAILIHEMAAGTESSTTFKLRTGVLSGNYYLNGNASARKWGGIIKVRLFVDELKA